MKITRRLTLYALLLGACAYAAAPAESSDDSAMDVKDLRVEFLPKNRVRVRGSMRCRGLRRIHERDDGWSSIAVTVDFPHGDRFSLLPTQFFGRSADGSERNWWDNKPHRGPFWYFNGKRYYAGKTKVPIYNSTWKLGPTILDEHLDDTMRDGKWIAFDQTLDFDRVLAKDRARYRVVVGWTFHFTDDFFEQHYHWVVYGPFDWGTAPPIDTTLTAGWGTPRSFTEKGVVTAEPDKSKLTRPKEDEPETEAEKPKLVRPSKAPTHLEAVEAAEQLKKTLNAMPGVTGAGVGLPPGVALILISHAPDLQADVIAQLTADVALATAHAAPWVDVVNIAISGGKRSSSVRVAWAALLKYSAGEMTPHEFCKAWTVEGDPLVIPEGK